MSNHPAADNRSTNPGDSTRRHATLVHDDDQPRDHGGDPVAPLTPTGHPYRFRLRIDQRSYYASTADDLLAVIIDGYPEPPQNPDDADQVDTYDQEALDARTLHAFGVIINHVAGAIIEGDLTPDDEALLRRSAERGPSSPPITDQECPIWTASTPMILITGLYHPSQRRQPPAGNVTFLDPGTPDTYLDDLARIGEIKLQQNPTFAPSRTELVEPDAPEDDQE